MDIKIEDIKIGDYVKVKAGVKAPGFEYQLMDNWQGKVIDIQKDEQLVDLEWDSETLMNTPEKYLRDLMNKGYDYEIMTLEVSELERANRRDNPKQREEIKAKLEAKLHWVELFGEEKSINYGKLFQGIKLDNDHEVYQKWEEYLIENLDFPIETKVVESEKGMIRNGEVIKLLEIEDYDEIYGIFGIGKHEKDAVTFPICNLEVIDKKSKNYELLRDRLFSLMQNQPYVFCEAKVCPHFRSFRVQPKKHINVGTTQSYDKTFKVSSKRADHRAPSPERPNQRPGCKNSPSGR